MASRTQSGEKPATSKAPPPKRNDKQLSGMRNNPCADWNIADVKAVADRLGLVLTKPTTGSHYKASSPHLEGILTIPAHKPIKPIYIKRFVALADTHLAHAQGDTDV